MAPVHSALVISSPTTSKNSSASKSPIDTRENPDLQAIGMAPQSVLGDIRVLIPRAITTQKLIQGVCGAGHPLIHEVGNLLEALQRLKKEARKDRSPLRKQNDVRTMDAAKLCRGCSRMLEDYDADLRKYKRLNTKASRGLKPPKSGLSSNQQSEILAEIQSSFSDYTCRILALTVKVSAEPLTVLQQQLDGSTGEAHALRFAVMRITSRLMAKHNSTFFVQASFPREETRLWDELQERLTNEGFSSAFLDRRREPILAYVDALERSSAPEKVVDPIAEDTKPGGQWCGTALYEDRNDDNNKFRTRKRARSFEAEPPNNNRDYREKRFVRFGNPDVVYGKLASDDDILADFLAEPATPSSHPPYSFRDSVRNIYRKLEENYEPRYRALGSLSGRRRDNEARALGYEVEKYVLEALDVLDLRGDEELRALKRMIIVRAQDLLGRLDKMK